LEDEKKFVVHGRSILCRGNSVPELHRKAIESTE
jgi:hypothetical protein